MWEKIMKRVPAIPIFLIIAAGTNLSLGGNMSDSDTTYVRPAAVAGQFYPGSPSDLAKTIAGLYHAAPKPMISGKPMVIIAPHAGYVYSGPIAARGYKILEGEEFSTVIVISPSHTVGFDGVSAFAGMAYTTPFGEIPIDSDLTRAIAANSDRIEISNVGHLKTGARSEHALEVQLPFLQTALGKFKLVALMMGSQDFDTCDELGEAISGAIGRRDDILVVASSDLSHFYDSDTAKRLDSDLENRVREFDYRGLAEDLSTGKTEACGGGPIVAAMIAAKNLGADSVKITGYGDSGDVTGDKSSVVGYLSAIIYKSKEAKVYDLDSSEEEIEDNPGTGIDFGLSSLDKKTLLQIARNSIDARLNNREIVFPEGLAGPLLENRGAFVTLTRDGSLRGCIGTFTSDEPLYKTVSYMALEAAFSDPRFTGVSKEELGDLKIEISVLTPMKRIYDPETVKVGRDGLYMKRGFRAGVLLPQVPVEYGWDRLKFLQQTCLKAGLSPDAWQSDLTELYTFQAEIFGED